MFTKYFLDFSSANILVWDKSEEKKKIPLFEFQHILKHRNSFLCWKETARLPYLTNIFERFCLREALLEENLFLFVILQKGGDNFLKAMLFQLMYRHIFASVLVKYKQKSRIRETSNLSTDADRRTDTILKRLRDLSQKKKFKTKI